MTFRSPIVFESVIEYPFSPVNWHGFPDTAIQTVTGQCFDLADPRAHVIDIMTIATALSRLPRFNGQTQGTRALSVAEHSVNVATALSAAGADVEVQLWGLLHDAAEAYMGDATRPLKKAVPGLVAVEAEILRAVALAFKLPFPYPDEVKDADNEMLDMEATAFMDPRKTALWWPKDESRARGDFLRTFHNLTRLRR